MLEFGIENWNTPVFQRLINEFSNEFPVYYDRARTTAADPLNPPIQFSKV